MPYGIKKILEMQAERKKRREEKARLKAEKEKQKKEEKKKERSKKLLKKRNARKYAKLKKAREEFHKSIGDEKGRYSVYLLKDGKRVKFFGFKLFKVAATQMYYEILNNNNENVQFHSKYSKTKNRIVPHKYELVLVKKIKDDEDNVSLLRNKEGKFVENYFIDSDYHKILIKNDWLVEEEFNVYGFDPSRDRKDFSYIYNNIILKEHENYSRILVYNNKLIVHYDNDFDMVICKSNSQSIELYEKIEKMIDTKKYPKIFFMGKIKGGTLSIWIVNEIVKKTGWSKSKAKFTVTIKNES